MCDQATEWWQLSEAAATLAAAFVHDPVMCFLFAEPAIEKRVLLLQSYFAAKLAGSITNNKIKVLIPKTPGTSNSQEVMSAAFWQAPPPLQPPQPSSVVASKYKKLSSAVVLGSLGDGPAAEGRLTALRELQAERPTTERHWYLQFIGTRAAGRGKGAVTDQCDAEGVGAYLESSHVANVPLYKAHGFKVVKTIILRGKGDDTQDSPELEVQVPIMWRDPKPPSTRAMQQAKL